MKLGTSQNSSNKQSTDNHAYLTHSLFKIKPDFFFQFKNWTLISRIILSGLRNKNVNFEVVYWNMSTIKMFPIWVQNSVCFSYLIFTSISFFVLFRFVNIFALAETWLCCLESAICYRCAFDYPTNSMKHENWPVYKCIILSTYL